MQTTYSRKICKISKDMNHIPYSKKVGLWLLEKSGCTLQDFCRKFNYPQRETDIIGLDEENEKESKRIICLNPQLRDLYLTASKDKATIVRKGQNRSFTQYFKDVITGWVLEDLIIEMLQSQGIDIKRNGRDSGRKIELGSSVNQQADCLITIGNCKRTVELTNEFNSILEEDGFIEKRAPALTNLWKNKSIWIYRDIKRGKYVLVDFATENTIIHLRRHNTSKADWSKDVQRYYLEENRKRERDDRLLTAEVISVVGCNIEGKAQPVLKEIEDEDSPPLEYSKGAEHKKGNDEQKQPIPSEQTSSIPSGTESKEEKSLGDIENTTKNQPEEAIETEGTNFTQTNDSSEWEDSGIDVDFV